MKINTILSVWLAASMLFGCSQNKESVKEKESTEKKELVTPTGNNSSLPYLTTGADGLLYFSWVESQGDDVVMKYATLSDDEWSSSQEVSRGNDWFVNWADYPMVSGGKNGMIAHFLKKSAPETFSYNVNMVIKKNKADWSNPLIIHSDSTDTEHGFVTMLPLSDSTFQVAWLDGRNTTGGHGAGAMSLRGAIMDLNGRLTQEVELDHRVCDCCQTGGAITDNGPIIIYRNRTEDEIRDMSIVRMVNGEWTEPKIIHNDGWNIAGCPVNGPRAAAVRNSLVIAWFTMANEKPQVNLIFSADGGANFDEPIVIDDADPYGRVDVILLDAQRAMVSWVAEKEDKKMINVKIVNVNGNVEKSMKIADFGGSRRNGFPQMEKNGDWVYFAWTNVAGEESTSVEVQRIAI